MTIQPSRDTPEFSGTFADIRLDYWPSGSDGPFTGTVNGSLDCIGRVVFDLRMEGLHSSLWHATGMLASGRITGQFWDPGSNSGTFTAMRRQAE
jgi:hypothetical protein